MKLLYIGNKLSKHGFNPTGIEYTGKLLEQFACVYYASDKLNKVVRLFDILFSVIKYARVVDYIIIDTYSTSNFIYAKLVGFIATFLGVDYIPVLRGGNLPALLQTNKADVFNFFRNAYCNVAPSNYLKSVFDKYNFKTDLIPNSIPLDAYSFKNRNQFKANLLYVRALADLYNPTMAIEVLYKLVSKGFDASLIMIGADVNGNMEKCKTLANKYNISNRVEFTGKLSKAQWHKKSTEADFLINTTNFDNTPISVIEAMALGLVVVSTNVGGMPFLIDDNLNGLLVPAEDEVQMSNAIEYLLNNNCVAHALVMQARKDVLQYDVNMVTTGWQRLLGYNK